MNKRAKVAAATGAKSSTKSSKKQSNGNLKIVVVQKRRRETGRVAGGLHSPPFGFIDSRICAKKSFHASGIKTERWRVGDGLVRGGGRANKIISANEHPDVRFKQAAKDPMGAIIDIHQICRSKRRKRPSLLQLLLGVPVVSIQLFLPIQKLAAAAMKVTAAAACLGLMLGLARGFLAPQVRPSRVVVPSLVRLHERGGQWRERRNGLEQVESVSIAGGSVDA